MPASHRIATALAALVLAWILANAALDRFLLAQGRLDLTRVARGESRIGFEFDSARDLIGDRIEGAGRMLVADGLLAAELPQGDANVRLNLRGLVLDARRLRALDLRLHVSAPATLHLIFDAPGELRQWQQRLELLAGWNELRMDLAAFTWSAHADAATARWGGDAGRVGEFRLHLAGPAGLRVALDHLRFRERVHHREGDPTPTIEWLGIERVRARLDAGLPLVESAHTRIGVRLPVWMDTPERLLTLRDHVRALDADALFWPVMQALPDAPGPAAAPTGWSPGWGGVVAYALLALWLRARARPRRLHALAELAIGHGPLLALSVGLGLSELPTSDARTWLACALLFQLSGLRISGGDWPGAATAWRAVARYSVPAAIMLIAIGVLAGHWQPPGLQRALGYLPFVLLQQTLLLGFLWPRVHLLVGRRAILATAGLFALAHAPNFALMLLSFVIAQAWLASYRSTRAWLPILTSHYALGMLAVSLLPSEILYSAETGLRYFQVR
ncbi:MAG: hypothetical protein IT479_04415 [Xanthomonadales bacterium]|nr:hypothetical protein [Xanthomonadales bacterium]MCC6592497.1 hypothetical protein [Xanthomonadales bacterium]MCE7932604.1 hypothetical protein [Xanthomonadales bacterium PRO6]